MSASGMILKATVPVRFCYERTHSIEMILENNTIELFHQKLPMLKILKSFQC